MTSWEGGGGGGTYGSWRIGAGVSWGLSMIFRSSGLEYLPGWVGRRSHDPPKSEQSLYGLERGWSFLH